MRYPNTMLADPQIDTLMLPFRSGELDQPGPGTHVLCAGFGEPLLELENSGCKPVYIQGFRPRYLDLVAAGCDVHPELDDGVPLDLAVIRLGRHRGKNERRICEAVQTALAGGWIVVVGGKTDGAASMRKRIAAAGIELAHTAKNHGNVFWFQVSEAANQVIVAFTSDAETALVDGRFQTGPGMFSHGRIDPGSQLLAGHMSFDKGARVADFCAGWGYLSVEALRAQPHLSQLHLFEADFASLEAARENVQPTGKDTIDYFWRDLLQEPVEHRYDAIVMNPPFHQGRQTEPDLGKRLIQVAAKALSSGGTLQMVANRQLPYEEVLTSHFSRFEELANDGSYKVLRAYR